MDSASPTISPLRFLSGLETQTFLYLSVMRFPAPRVPRQENAAPPAPSVTQEIQIDDGHRPGNRDCALFGYLFA